MRTFLLIISIFFCNNIGFSKSSDDFSLQKDLGVSTSNLVNLNSGKIMCNFKRFPIKEFFSSKSEKNIFYGKIYALTGITTSGKTSIINKLRDVDPSLIELGLDLESNEYIADKIKEKMKYDYDIIVKVIDHNNIAKAIFHNQIIYKENISNEDKNIALLTLEKMQKIKTELGQEILGEDSGDDYCYNVEKRIFDKVMSVSSKEKKTIIFDFYDGDFFNEYFNRKSFVLPIKVVLVYCPLKKVIERVLIRNEEAEKIGDISNIRPPMEPIHQFVDKYIGKTDFNEKDQILEILTYQQFDEIFEAAYKAEETFLKKREKVIPFNFFVPDHDALKKEYMKRIGFVDPSIQKVAIVSKFENYQYLFHTESNAQY